MPVTGSARRREDLSLCRVQQELLLLDLEFKKIHQLNETASFVWDMWGEVPDEAEVAKLFAQKFDVGEDTALRDVSTVVAKLRELNLLVG